MRRGARNPHAPIVWKSGDPRFAAFLQKSHCPASQQPGVHDRHHDLAAEYGPTSAFVVHAVRRRSRIPSDRQPDPNGPPAAKSARRVGGGWKPVPVAGRHHCRRGFGLTVGFPAGAKLHHLPAAFFRRPHKRRNSAQSQHCKSRPNQRPATMPPILLIPAATAPGRTAAAALRRLRSRQPARQGRLFTARLSRKAIKARRPPAQLTRKANHSASSRKARTLLSPSRAASSSRWPKKGDSFALDFVSGYNDAGIVGVALTTAEGTAGSFVFHSQGVGILFNDKPTGVGFVPGASHLVYTLTSPTTYSLTVTGADAFTGTGTFTGPITGFQVQQTNSGSTKPDHNAYFNNLALTHAPH